jgi:hypothetical protein
MPILYKYRNFNNWQFILDIFINKRLHAAPYTQLNDPMEGMYYYNDRDSYNIVTENIRNEKQRTLICSLSSLENNNLMWSHYADSHRGIIFGVEIDAPIYPAGPPNADICTRVHEVEYVSDFIDITSDMPTGTAATARKILSKKLLPWGYEKEFRVFSRDEYIPIKIVSITFGLKFDDSLTASLIRGLKKKFCPQATIKTMQETELR